MTKKELVKSITNIPDEWNIVVNDYGVVRDIQIKFDYENCLVVIDDND